MPAEARTCGRCGNLALPEHTLTLVVVGVPPAFGSRVSFRCTGCAQRFRLLSVGVLALQGVAVAITLGLVALAPFMGWFFAPIGLVPLALIGLDLHTRRRHPEAPPGTAALLDRALADPGLQAAVRKFTGSR
jgi:hypothetical protein